MPSQVYSQARCDTFLTVKCVAILEIDTIKIILNYFTQARFLL